MIDFAGLENQLADVIASSTWLAPAAAFGGGVLTALNPCVLATVPLIIGVVGGYAQGEGAWKRAAAFSFFFVFGFALELAVLFSVSAAFAPYLTGPYWKYVIAVVSFFLGLHLLFDFQLPAIASLPSGKWGGLIGVTLLGFMFGLVSMPCSGPVLMLLASLVPEIGIPKAGTLLFLYGVGHSVLILIAGISVGTVQALADSKGMNRGVAVTRKIAGVLIIGVGIYFLRS
ncbi:MAG: cytochrome c biogenesis protein CcdA [Candidatus Ozemobacteraceae bacterium]